MDSSIRPGDGFTLLELLIVVAVVGILGAVAYPSYVEHIKKTHRTTAQADLLELANFMQRVHTELGCYDPGPDDDCTTSNDAAAPTLPFSQSPKEGSSKYYNLSVQAVGSNTFTLRATPISGTRQASDGYLEIDQAGRRKWDRNNDGDTDDTDEDTWS